MRDIERLQHELHSKLPAFQHKVERSQRIIEKALGETTGWGIAFSGGVDSTVLLHMLYSSGYRIPVYWGCDGYDYRETLDFLASTEDCYGFTLQRIRCMQPWRDWCNEMDRADLCDDPQALQAWGNPHQWDDTWDSLKDARNHGHNGVFLGLLASESRERRMILHNGARPLYQVKSEQDMWHCSPLASWTKQEVWAYAISRGLPYNPVYDRLAELDVPLERRRVAPLTCFRVVQYGSHGHILKSIDPALYNRLAATFPKVRGYT